LRKKGSTFTIKIHIHFYIFTFLHFYNRLYTRALMNVIYLIVFLYLYDGAYICPILQLKSPYLIVPRTCCPSYLQDGVHFRSIF